MDEVNEKDKIAIAVEMSWEFSHNRGMSFRTTVSRDIDQHELDGILDKLRTAITRQDLFQCLYSHETKIRFEEEKLCKSLNELQRLDERYPDISIAPRDAKDTHRQQRDIVLNQQALVNILHAQLDSLSAQLNGGTDPGAGA